jgi:hypothetical protein
MPKTITPDQLSYIVVNHVSSPHGPVQIDVDSLASALNAHFADSALQLDPSDNVPCDVEPDYCEQCFAETGHIHEISDATNSDPRDPELAAGSRALQDAIGTPIRSDCSLVDGVCQNKEHYSSPFYDAQGNQPPIRNEFPLYDPQPNGAAIRNASQLGDDALGENPEPRAQCTWGDETKCAECSQPLELCRCPLP